MQSIKLCAKHKYARYKAYPFLTFYLLTILYYQKLNYKSLRENQKSLGINPNECKTIVIQQIKDDSIR
jgi:hypothetical protein